MPLSDEQKDDILTLVISQGCRMAGMSLGTKFNSQIADTEAAEIVAKAKHAMTLVENENTITIHLKIMKMLIAPYYMFLPAAISTNVFQDSLRNIFSQSPILSQYQVKIQGSM